MVYYQIPSGVKRTTISHRPGLTTLQGGRIALDAKLVDLWELADAKHISEILKNIDPSQGTQNEVRAGLACLAEAGLLIRQAGVEAKTYTKVSGPLISIIIVTHNSRNWLDDCLHSIANQTYRSLEILVVDNGSEDDIKAWISSNHPQVKFHSLEYGTSFAEAINLGVAEANGEHLLLLNPDTRLEPDAVSEMYGVIEDNLDCAAVAAKLKLWWAPGFLNGLGNRVGAFSWGTDNGLGHLDLGQFDSWEELPSACFAAALVSRNAWERVGPVDVGFQMYYEDSEWSYRARLKGYKIYAAPDAVVYHAFGGRFPGQDISNFGGRKLQNVVYGRLRFASKLLGRYLALFLISYIFEDMMNILRYLFTLNWGAIPKILNGWINLLRDLPEIYNQRRDVRSGRLISEQSLFSLQRNMPVTNMWKGVPELTWDLVQNQYLPLFIQSKTHQMPEFISEVSHRKLLIVSHDIVDSKMAGPGMRYLEMGRALSEDLDVTLAIPNQTTISVPGIIFAEYHEERPESLKKLVDNSDVVIISSNLLDRYPFLWRTQARVVVDFYDPFVLENLHYYVDEPFESQESLNKQSVDFTNQLARIGDFYICGNERQRDYWLGVLTANGRVNPVNFKKDPSLRELIDVVGMGFPNRKPQPNNLFRGIHPLIPAEARIVLWGGGIWDWLDPLTLIKAWPKVVHEYPEARLILLGTRHPNPNIPRHKMVEQAQTLAEEIGEKDKSIIFFEWLSYQDREALLCDAYIGITLHPVHIETRYSIRTRILDYLWAQIPIVVTDGDITSEWVRQFKIGAVVPQFDDEAVARALISILSKPKDSWAPAFEPLGEKFSWSRVVSPLRRYCSQGSYAPDRKDRQEIKENQVSTNKWRVRWARARFILRAEGWRSLSHRTWRYLQWRLATRF